VPVRVEDAHEGDDTSGVEGFEMAGPRAADPMIGAGLWFMRDEEGSADAYESVVRRTVSKEHDVPVRRT